MSAKSIFTILFICVIGNYAWADGCTAPPVTLKKDQWKQISLPCEPKNREDEVTIIFGGTGGTGGTGGIDGTYDKDWVVFSYDGSNYVKMESTDYLEQGKGYWIIQIISDEVSIKMPDSASSTPTFSASNTPPIEAFAHKLTVASGSVAWNFIGNPYASVLKMQVSEGLTIDDNPVVKTQTGACKGGGPVVACGLNKAAKEEIFHNQLFRYNAATEAYEKLADGAELKPWDGFWGATLGQADTEKTEILYIKPKP